MRRNHLKEELVNSGLSDKLRMERGGKQISLPDKDWPAADFR